MIRKNSSWLWSFCLITQFKKKLKEKRSDISNSGNISNKFRVKNFFSNIILLLNTLLTSNDTNAELQTNHEIDYLNRRESLEID